MTTIDRFRTFVLAAVLAIAGSVSLRAQCQPFRVLVFTKTAGFVHGPQIAAGVTLIQSLGTANGFGVDHTADATAINAANLARYAVVVFLHTTGDVLDAAQQTAFEGWIASGGGFVGIHSAADTEYGWPFYGALLGAWFQGHPPVQAGTLSVVDASHASTAGLPATFVHVDEWYDFSTNVATNPAIRVLLTVDESTYTGGSMGAVHPIAWCQDGGTWRSWYTGLGHDLAQYTTPRFASHVLGGIVWCSQSLRASTICAATPYGASSGAGTVALAGAPSAPTHVTLTVSGASPGGIGMLGLSTCGASATAGGLTFHVDLAPPALLALASLTFDAAGAAQLVLPYSVYLPGNWGRDLYLQAAEVAPLLTLSNGLRLSLCP
jgi:type 1 glutamine amidotransferase